MNRAERESDRRTRSEASPIQIDYQPGLDGLRAVAIVAVLVFHSDLGWLPGGFLGVSVFFTLSGFLITSLLIAEVDRSGRVGLAEFWERRFRRLLPASLITIVGVCLAAVWLSTPVEQSRLRGDAITAVFYVGNWRSIVSKLSYDDIFSTTSPLIHLWSLGIEEQMYVLVPILVAGLVWRGMGRRALGFVALVLAGMSASISLFVVEGDRLYYGTDTRAAELLVGVGAAAFVGPAIWAKRWRASTIVSWASLGGLVAFVVVARLSSTNSTWVYAGLLPVFALVSLLCVIGSVIPGPMRTILSMRPLVFIGRISYGLYLFHWPIFTWMTEDRLGFGGGALFITRVAVTTSLTLVSFVGLERPIRQRRFLASRRSFVGACVGASLVAVGVPLTVLDSVPGRPSTDVKVLSTVPTTSPHSEVLPTELERVLVIGDSTAENVARAVATTGSLGVISAGVLGCPLVSVAEVFDRPRASQETSYCPDNVEILRTHAASIDLVFVVGGVANQWSYRRESGDVVDPGSSQYKEQFDRLMEDFHEVLAPWGVPIVVLDNPVTRPDDGVVGDEPAAHDAWRAQIERWDERWETVVRLNIDDALADPASPEGRRQRPDGVHLEEEFAANLAQARIVPELASLYGALLSHLADIGCRTALDGRAVLELVNCRVDAIE